MMQNTKGFRKHNLCAYGLGFIIPFIYSAGYLQDNMINELESFLVSTNNKSNH